MQNIVYKRQREIRMESTVLQMVQTIGIIGVLALIAALYIRDRGKSEAKTTTTVSEIALDSTEQVFKKSDQLTELFRQLGDVRQDLGREQGKNIELTRNFELEKAKREEMRNKIEELDGIVKTQQSTITRHEGRIAELETEGKRKDDVIADKDAQIARLNKNIADLLIEKTELAKRLDELKAPPKTIEVAMTPVVSDETLPLPTLPETEEANTEEKKSA
jgi:chromosome segregation ATPase